MRLLDETFNPMRRLRWRRALRPHGSPRNRLSMQRRLLMPFAPHELKAIVWLRRNKWRK